MSPSLRRVLLAAALLLPTGPAMAQTVKAVMHSDLKIVDPVFSGAYIVRNHAFMIWDQLFAVDENFKPQPQMVETWSTSEDGLTWTFTLRDGLEFHDGQPVTSEDCIASIQRFAKRDTLGLKFAQFVSAYEAVDARTFRIVLKSRFGLVLETLAKPSLLGLFIMPKRVAQKEATVQIDRADLVGSGPFIFKQDEWAPGAKVVYVRNPKYKPRAEPPSGLAGGKVVHLERVEWHWLPDAQTQINALQQGEIDMVESVQTDLLPLVERDRGIRVMKGAGLQYIFRVNFLYPPFNNVKIRQAAQIALQQEPFLQAAVGDPRFWQVCKSLFPCGTEYDFPQSFAGTLDGNAAKARALLQEAGYDGTPVLLLHPTDVHLLSSLAPIAKAQLERAGFKVELAAADWQTTTTRIRRKEPVAQGGWNAYLTAYALSDVLNPATYSTLNTDCKTSLAGWPCDDEMEAMRDRFVREIDPAKKKALALEIAQRNVEQVFVTPVGEFFWVSAMRSSVQPLPNTPVMVFWGMTKK